MLRKLLISMTAALPVMMYGSDNDWLITAERVDTMQHYVEATAANGELGFTIGRRPMEIKHVVCASAFENGNPDDIALILTAPNPLGLEVVLPDGKEWTPKSVDQTIDMKRAVHGTVMKSDLFDIDYTLRALRSLPHAGLVQLKIKAKKDVELALVNSHTLANHLRDRSKQDVRRTNVEGHELHMLRTDIRYNSGDDNAVVMSGFVGGANTKAVAPDTLEIKLKKGETAEVDVYGVICTSSEFTDPWNEAEREVIYAVHEGSDKLIERHEQIWADLWKNDVVVPGDDELTHNARFALYNLYGSMLPGSRRSVAPVGLTGLGYYGHVFWDAETWMFPALLDLNPEMAKDMISYRIDHLESARRRARAYGYRGAMFPWESDNNGEESTPTWALTGPMEHHITADIANAAWEYFKATNDTVWLRNEGYPLIKECADFWVSRATPNDDGSFSICNVVCADEYAIGVDDNAFTNGAAAHNLRVAKEAAGICGQNVDSRWETVADGLRFLKMDNGVTAEYDGYKGGIIKQADANLLAFPLNVITDKDQIRRDLDYYSERIDPNNGPAMARSVLAVLYHRLGDDKEARRQLELAYKPNLRAPFGVFAETPTNNNCYFMTGAGAFIKALLELYPENKRKVTVNTDN